MAVSTTQIHTFGETGLDAPIGRLIFRGGLALVAQDDTFGGAVGRCADRPESAGEFCQ
ncbi:MAG: hypothetical protein MO852_15240 [Candidatus Devosia euplotis]|nr:hypothetical protein [Candidatus Devosia euplotis]